MAPRDACVRQRIAAVTGDALLIHDTAELDCPGLDSLGSHQNREHDYAPDRIVLRHEWTKLENMSACAHFMEAANGGQT